MTSGCGITGLGAVSCFGVGTGALWSAMIEGRDGLRPIARFSTLGFGVSQAALVPAADGDFGSEGSMEQISLRLLERYALAAAREARADAGLDTHTYCTSRAALVLGTSPGDSNALVHELSEKLGDALGLCGPRLTVSTACSSSTNAVGLAADLLRDGAADVVLAGGTDVITPLLFAGFHVLGVLSRTHCAPFSHPSGTVLGEGAGFVVLEREQDARARGARLRARLLGYGLSCDAFHETSPDPTGAGVARAVGLALRAAGLRASEVDYVSAHGTGTLANDPAEWRALRSVLGSSAETTPISSSKSFLGHAQAAAGILELLATVLCMERGLVPHTLHHDGPRPLSPTDVVAGSAPRAANVRYAVSTNSAFAGANAALAIAAPSSPARSAVSSEPRLVRVSAVASEGFLAEPELTSFSEASLIALASASLSKHELLQRMPQLDAGGSDRSTLLLLALTKGLLDEAGLRTVSTRGERTGLVLGITRVSPESLAEVLESVRARGLLRVAPTGFSRMVLSAPAGACARAFRLKGPMSTLSTGVGSGLVALIYAARLLQAGQADTMLGVGVDEAVAGPSTAAFGAGECEEGAAGALLEATPGGLPLHGIRLAGMGLAGPGRGSEAIRDALAESGVSWGKLDLVVADEPELFGGRMRTVRLERGRGGPAASTAASGVAFAARALARGTAGRALICSTRGNSTSCATVLTKEGP